MVCKERCVMRTAEWTDLIYSSSTDAVCYVDVFALAA